MGPTKACAVFRALSFELCTRSFGSLAWGCAVWYKAWQGSMHATQQEGQD